MPKNIALITDSTCDIPEHLRQQYNIYLVPLTIVWGKEQFLDRVGLQAEDFYARLSTDPVRPTTSQPTPKDFLAKYEQAKADGAEEIVVIVISSAMSGTIGSARTAAEGFDLPVHIFDSRSNSMSLGWQVLAAARAREAGSDAQGMLDAADAVRKQLHYHIVLDTTEFLLKGGRVAGAASKISSMLQIKLQIRVNHETGSVEAGDITRTRKQAIDKLFSSFVKFLDLTKPAHIAVLHNAALAEAEALVERIRQEIDPSELILTIVSPVLGVHTGPQAIALCGYSEA
ncbi:MAG: DegV family protein [Anaerolineaceae bacterium]|nr:DegV family protein [Anaerolineaceae bacterium]